MTCIIGFVNTQGNGIIAADTCVSLRFSNHSNIIYRDEIQKIYGLSPRILVAYTTDDIATVCQFLRYCQTDICRSVLINLHDKKKNRLYNIKESLKRLFDRLGRQFISNRNIIVQFLIAIQVPSSGMHIYMWAQNEFREIPTNTIEVLGSIDQHTRTNICSALRSNVLNTINLNAIVELTAQTLYQFANNQVTHLHAIGIGGLFQIASNENGQFVQTSYDSYSYNNEGNNIAVTLRYNNSRWYQVNFATNQSIPVIDILNYNLRSVSNNNNLFYFF